MAETCIYCQEWREDNAKLLEENEALKLQLEKVTKVAVKYRALHINYHDAVEFEEAEKQAREELELEPRGKYYGRDKLWQWFGLSRSSWLTMPRAFMHDMPEDWQSRMAALCEEWDRTWANWPDVMARVQITNLEGKLIKTPCWLNNYRHPDRSKLMEIRGEKP